jgi:hypothetical protein
MVKKTKKTPVSTREIIVMVAGKLIALERCDKGYYLGEIIIGSGNMNSPEFFAHVEAVEIIDEKDLCARNNRYQSIPWHWCHRNDNERPKLLTIGKRKYFISIDVYAK